MYHKYWACAVEPGAAATEAPAASSPCSATREVTTMRSPGRNREPAQLKIGKERKVLKKTKTQELCSSAPRRKEGCKICQTVGKLRLNPTKQWVGVLKQMAFFFF